MVVRRWSYSADSDRLKGFSFFVGVASVSPLFGLANLLVLLNRELCFLSHRQVRRLLKQWVCGAANPWTLSSQTGASIGFGRKRGLVCMPARPRKQAVANSCERSLARLLKCCGASSLLVDILFARCQTLKGCNVELARRLLRNEGRVLTRRVKAVDTTAFGLDGVAKTAADLRVERIVRVLGDLLYELAGQRKLQLIDGLLPLPSALRVDACISLLADVARAEL